MWFAVNLLLRSTRPNDPQADGPWEESLFLIRADAEEEARREAERIGRAEEHEYVSATGDLVRWRFQQIESVSPIEALEHGSQLFSRFLSKQEAESLLAAFKE
jgi:hypothetical protein